MTENQARITLDISKEFHREVKLIALYTGRSMAEITRTALMEYVEKLKNEEKK